MTELRIEATPIPGLLVVHLPVHGDARGWFKENWQRSKMTALGLPDFGPVQNNISFNAARGATRGIHAEPWDKLVSVATGRVFGAWVDLRAGESFGRSFHLEVDESVAVFVPRGVGNAFQTLQDGTAYSYLVNDHWRPGIGYPALALDDETAAIPWPIDLAECEISDKDRQNPRLAQISGLPPRRPLIIGATGQVGRAMRTALPSAVAVDRATLDLADPSSLLAHDWSQHDVVINTAAMTAVDAAETPQGRRAAWAVNATAVGLLARLAVEHRFTLVHFSSDYVFDGVREVHPEDEPFSPLGTYGQSKAAGDLAVMAAPRHYLLRTSWVIGEGRNFVATMRDLARRGVSPSVVDDQVGRLTFADELARATLHLLRVGAPYGTYNVSNSGDPMSWCDIARLVFEHEGRAPGDVTATSTAAYLAGREGISPRPPHSTLDLTRLRATGFTPTDQTAALRRRLG